MRAPLTVCVLLLAPCLAAPASASEPMIILVDWKHGFFAAGAGTDAPDAAVGTSLNTARFPFGLDACHRRLYLDLLYEPESAGGGTGGNSVEVVYEWRAEVWNATARIASKRILSSSYGHVLGEMPEAGPHELRVVLVVGANVTWSLRLRAWEVVGEPACLPPVFINEVEANPAGVDAGNESIELYNPAASPLDVSGWFVRTTHGVTEELRLPEGTFVPAGGRLRITFGAGQFLDNEDESVRLHDGLGWLRDETPLFTDAANDGRTWQRATDGAPSWEFRAGTLDAPNG